MIFSLLAQGSLAVCSPTWQPSEARSVWWLTNGLTWAAIFIANTWRAFTCIGMALTSFIRTASGCGILLIPSWSSIATPIRRWPITRDSFTICRSTWTRFIRCGALPRRQRRRLSLTSSVLKLWLRWKPKALTSLATWKSRPWCSSAATSTNGSSRGTPRSSGGGSAPSYPHSSSSGCLWGWYLTTTILTTAIKAFP